MKGKLEVIIIGIFALIFLVWAVNKCTSGKEKLSEAAAAEAKEDSLAAVAKPPSQSGLPPLPLNPTTAAGQPAANPAQAGQSTTAPIATPAAGTATPGASGTAAAAQPAAKPAEAPKEPQLSKLYVTIDKLKLRKSPGLKGESLGELKLFDEVYFMNEMTDSTTELSIGKEIVNEPWVKVKTKKGTVGWVYGAGVHYHKKKRSGTLE